MLLFPRQMFRWGPRFGKRRARPVDETFERDRRDLSVRLGEECGKGRNWFDFFRALAGGLALFQMAVILPPEPTTFDLWMACIVLSPILILAIIVQTVRKEDRVILFPPLFFMMGLSIPVIGAIPATIAIVAIAALNLGLPSPSMFLVVFGAICGGLDVLFDPDDWRYSIVIFIVSIVPVLISLMTRRRLVTISRRPRQARG